jgi:hypothetical protein
MSPSFANRAAAHQGRGPTLQSPAVIARRTTRIRPFVEADIPQVARVHRAAFKPANEISLASYHDYFVRVFLQNPAGRAIASLVHEEPDGRITGFVGLVPRWVAIGASQYNAAVSSQFIVDPASHVGLVALRLAKAYLEGPQDLSIADEANDVSRRIWEGLGGITASLLSLYWTRPLRPARMAMSYLRERRGFAPIAAAGRPFATAADALTARLPGSQFRRVAPATTAEPLCTRTVVARAPEFCGPASLRVDYDDHTFQWLLERAATQTPDGRLLSAVVKDRSAILGWYIAHLDRNGAADVAQLVANPTSIDAVLDHLFHHAWQQGAVSVTGRMEPRFMQVLSDKYCLFHRRGPWVLIKAKRPELMHAFQTGATSFSRFDGEWSLRYQS